MAPSPIQRLTRLRRWARVGFTLVETLVAVSALVLMLALMLSITTYVSKTVIAVSSKIDAYAAARAAFDLMGQKLSQATLNTYWDYDNPLTPTTYLRQSDLEFLVRQNVQYSGYGQEVYFQTPADYSSDTSIRSTDGLLNACGYFIQYGSSQGFQPGLLPTATYNRYRFRLMQGLEATENFAVYSSWPTVPANGSAASAWTTYWTGTWTNYWSQLSWIANISNQGTGALNATDVEPLADNVIALVVWPRLSTVDDALGTKLAQNPASPTYVYDSQYKAFPTTGTQPLWANQMPPTVQLTLITISEASAARIDTKSATPPSVITTALGTNASTGAGVFTNPLNYQSDLTYVSQQLAQNHIDFRILNTSVAMRESKWSDNSQ